MRVIALAALTFAGVQGAQERNAQNPVRQVVTLLQKMQKQVQEERAREAELYDQFQCYCKTGGSDLSASISAAEEKIPAVSNDVERAEAKLAGTKSALKQAQSDRSAAQAAVAEATSIRGKEASTFAKFKSDYETNIAALAKAIDAISKGAAGSFVQTRAAQVIRRAVSKANLEDSDLQAVTAFLSQSSDYAPQSGQITGILKTLHDEMSATLADGTSTEDGDIASFNSLMAAKKKEIAALQASIESKLESIGELGVSIATMKNDVGDTQAALAADTNFLAQLEKGCATKDAEWAERSKTRAAELVALADTIKVLNDDDALELFKKTLPSASASFLQVQQGMSALRAKARTLLRSAKASAAASNRPGLEMLMLALNGNAKPGTFDKVVKLIDNLVALLKKEQTDDDNKKDYCAHQLDEADDKKKFLERSISSSESSIATSEETIATLSQEIAALEAGIRSLDKSVAEATSQRKNENAEFKSLMASNTAAKELLNFAKNRLNQFYNPKLYRAPPKVESSTEDRLYTSMGGSVPTTAPGGIAGTGITVFAQIALHSDQHAAPVPPPDTWGAYASQSQGNTGVMAMIELLIKDLDKDMTEAETEEKDSQADYEEMMSDSAAKRTTDSQSLNGKSAAKADATAALEAHTDARAEGASELMATTKFISSLHAECDFLLKYVDARREARASEVDSLNRAKAVLNSADYSLVETSISHSFLRRE